MGIAPRFVGSGRVARKAAWGALTGLSVLVAIAACGGGGADDSGDPAPSSPAVCVADIDCKPRSPCLRASCDQSTHRCVETDPRICATCGAGAGSCRACERCNLIYGPAEGVCEPEPNPSSNCVDAGLGGQGGEGGSAGQSGAGGSAQSGSGGQSGTAGTATGGTGGAAGTAGGAGQGGSGGGAACVTDGKCDITTEACTCADCVGTPVCGAGCTSVKVLSFKCFGFACEGGAEAFDGPLSDNFQVILLQAGSPPGVYPLSPVSKASECGKSTVCPMMVSEAWAGKRYRHVSGLYEATQTGGKFTNVRFETAMQTGDDVTSYMPTDCVFLGSFQY